MPESNHAMHCGAASQHRWELCKVGSPQTKPSWLRHLPLQAVQAPHSFPVGGTLPPQGPGAVKCSFARLNSGSLAASCLSPTTGGQLRVWTVPSCPIEDTCMTLYDCCLED